MSRVLMTTAIVVVVAVLVLTGYDIVNVRMGLPSIMDVLGSLWPNVVSGVGDVVSANKKLLIVILAGLIVALLLSRFPRFGKY